MTSTTVTNSRHYDINRRMVLSFLNVGLGFAGLSTFCECAGLQGLTEKSYNKHVMDIHKATDTLKSSVLEEAVAKVKAAYGASSIDAGMTDIAVSYDGTWQKRGHTSKHGLGVVIEVTTGLAIDYHVMASYCQQCASVGPKKKAVSQEAFDLWFETHKEVCTVNHHGSAGMMEVEVAKVLWGRSTDKGLRYTTLVSDGDCKTHNELVKLRPYGDTAIVKEECTNHVSKRLGTALRTLVTTHKGKGVTLGGRKAGSLSQVKIAVLQAHYKKAVASKCKSTEELRRKIWCTFSHASSTDENPLHHDCPTGRQSWCFYQRALAFGKPTPSHKGKSSSYISAEVAKAARPIYERLSADALLERCLRGLTQNANESLHATIWARCPKHLFAGRRRIEIASTIAITTFNCGSKALHRLLSLSGCLVSTETVKRGQRRDRKRIATAEKRQTKEAKRRRTEIVRATAIAQQEYLRNEDGPSYLSGAF